MPSFTTLWTRTDVVLDILVLIECWLQTTKFIPQFDGYTFISTTSHKTLNEGLVIYYKMVIKIEEPPFVCELSSTKTKV